MKDLEKLEIPTIEFTSVTMLNFAGSTHCGGDDGDNTEITGGLGIVHENVEPVEPVEPVDPVEPGDY